MANASKEMISSCVRGFGSLTSRFCISVGVERRPCASGAQGWGWGVDVEPGESLLEEEG